MLTAMPMTGVFVFYLVSWLRRSRRRRRTAEDELANPLD
jgi:hypothetical protein